MFLVVQCVSLLLGQSGREFCLCNFFMYIARFHYMFISFLSFYLSPNQLCILNLQEFLLIIACRLIVLLLLKYSIIKLLMLFCYCLLNSKLFFVPLIVVVESP